MRSAILRLPVNSCAIRTVGRNHRKRKMHSCHLMPLLLLDCGSYNREVQFAYSRLLVEVIQTPPKSGFGPRRIAGMPTPGPDSRVVFHVSSRSNLGFCCCLFGLRSAMREHSI